MSVAGVAAAIWLFGILVFPEQSGVTVGEFLRSVKDTLHAPAQDQKGDSE